MLRWMFYAIEAILKSQSCRVQKAKIIESKIAKVIEPLAMSASDRRFDSWLYEYRCEQ